MIVIPSKNPGHSGTDFKHRKSFYKASQGQKKKVKTNGQPLKRPVDDFRTTDWAKRLSFVCFLCLLSPLVWLVFSVVGQGKSLGLMDPQVPVHETPSLTPMQKEAVTAYTVLTQTGFDYLAGLQLDEAQAEFILALQQDPLGKRA
ncbi:MAG: hypothetical protein AAGH79_13440 [Bacteroidota bacterium]